MAPQRPASPPTFRVVAIGPRGSGKTLYLAAMHFQTSSHWVEGVKVRLERDDQSTYLDRVYDKATDPEESEWPETTKSGLEGLGDFVFSVVVQRRRKGRTHHYRAFEFSYLDYAGEIFGNADRVDPEFAKTFTEHRSKADALLGIIDGHRLLLHMHGHEDGASFERDLKKTVERIGGTGKPVHFLLNKWDMLQDTYTLDQIVQVLMDSNTGFRDLVANYSEQRRSGPVGSVRLIPVSALGRLAYLDQDWAVGKDPSQPASRLNVEIPLLAAVADICDLAVEQQLKGKLDAAEGHVGKALEADKAKTEKRQLMDMVRNVASGGTTADLFKLLLALVHHSPGIVIYLTRPAAWLGLRGSRQVRRVQAHQLRSVTSTEKAIYYVAYQLRKRLDVFERAEPASMLVSGWQTEENAVTKRAEIAGIL